MPRSYFPVTDAVRPAGPGRRRLLRYAVGSVILAIGGQALIVGQPFSDHRNPVGGRRTIVLPDGSTAELAGTAELSVEYGPAARRVVLHRGQAFFRVRPLPGRPFAVDAGPGRIEAADAADFAVVIVADRATVSVSVGDVAVAGTEVAAGRLLRYGPEGVGSVLDAPAD